MEMIILKKEKKNTKKKKFNFKFLKIIPLIIFIIPIVIFVIMKCSNTSYRINYFLFIFIQLANLIWMIAIFRYKDKVSKWIVIVSLLYCVAIFFAPMYSNMIIHSSKDSDAKVSGMKMENVYKNIYGIKIFSK